MSTQITRDEWLNALAEAGVGIQDDPSAITIPEFMAMFGLTSYTASRRLKSLVAKGLAIETKKVAPGRDGRRCEFLAYRLLDVNPKVKAKKRPS